MICAQRHHESACRLLGNARTKMVDGVCVEEHSRVSRVMKGAFNSHTPSPKYTATWKVCTVLDYIVKLGTN